MSASNPLRPGLALGFVAVALLAAAGGYFAGRAPAAAGADAPKAAASAPDSATMVDGRKVLYWYDPMKPEARFDKPGRSPFMEMDLVPRFADEVQAEGGISVDPRTTQSLGVRLAVVERATVGAAVEAAGSIVFNERDVAIVQARSGGFVERVTPRAPGDVIAAGAVLAEVLVPEWAGAQQEYLALRKTQDTALAGAARQRLLLLGMPESLVREVEAAGQVKAVTAITAPSGGVIQEMMVRPGMSLMPGMTLARINGIATVWLEVAVPEVHAALLAPGRTVQATMPAFPGQTFSGRIAAVLPEGNKDTRTLRVRIELANRGGLLKAGMLARARIAAPAQAALWVPSEAVIRTGERNVVFVAGEMAGQFVPVEVTLGAENGGRIQIVKGLDEGQKVVASGQFLIDSEASLAKAVAGASPAASAPAAAPMAGTAASAPAGPAAHDHSAHDHSGHAGHAMPMPASGASR
ncbi:MAG: efflux RND transporter periplasmic adaptor subunit [Rubrivivax sp.]|nr:efflux RND transporter periplasmic adaptor subunit [Rubrivivax sp.]